MPDDPQLEAFLKRFRPRRPRPLPHPGRWPGSRRWILAAAAAVVLAVGMWRWAPQAEPPSGPSAPAFRGPAAVTVTRLDAAVRAGGQEAALDELNVGLLPDPARAGGALRVLADVSRDRWEPSNGRPE